MKHYQLMAVAALCFIGLSACTSPPVGEPAAGPLTGDVVYVDSFNTLSPAPRIVDARLSGLVLVLDVEYSGGCAEHRFQLAAGMGFLESNPVQKGLRVLHHDGGDPCDGLLRSSLSFGLQPLVDEFAVNYRSTSGTMILNLRGWPESLRFDF